ncbi:MAG: MFS transporter [Candidatus Heimdallarchaeota archaeon]|nr:MFS transporter [Candidatus Heimdallarchaeota archaeon]
MRNSFKFLIYFIVMSSDEKIPEETGDKLVLSPVSDEIVIESKTSFWNVFKWSMYDLANTIYSMVIVSLIINQYVLIIGQAELGLEYTQADAIYNIVFAIMQIIVAIGMPIMGALSDSAGRRKPFVLVLTGIILIFASLLGIYHSITMVLIFYTIANIAYQWSLAFYDAMLPFIANPKDVGKVGGFGVAFGYFGTLIGMGVMLALQTIWGGPVSNITESNPELKYGYYGNPWTFVIAMGLFALCAIPFLFVKERKKSEKMEKFGLVTKNALKQVGQTFKEIRKHKEMFKFIIGYFLVVDVANIIVAKMFLIVRDGLLMDESFSMIFIIISTVSAVAFTYFIGMIADKWGGKVAFFVVGGLWAVAMVIGVLLIFFSAPIDVGFFTPVFNFPFILVLLMGIIAGPALGGTWVAQRAMVTELAPKEKFGEYMGFSKLSGKISSSVGPLVWTGVFLLFERIAKHYWGIDNYSLNMAYGYAMLVVGIIMAIGLVIIGFVKPERNLIHEGEALEESG